MAKTRGAKKKSAAKAARPAKKKAARKPTAAAKKATPRKKPAAKPARKPAAKKKATPKAKKPAAKAPKPARKPAKQQASKPAAKEKKAAPKGRARQSVTPAREEEKAAPVLEESTPEDTEEVGEFEIPAGLDLRGASLDEPVSPHPDSHLTQRQVEMLHRKLVAERARVLAGFDRHLAEALGEAGVMPDETDMAQRSTEQAYLIRFADKERKLLSEIERALDKMRTGEYGVCEGTEEPIGYKRLELRPWTRYSVAYKEQIERERSQHRR